MKFTLIKTCNACPEQYDVLRGERQVGYLRLRNGYFRCDYPSVEGETIYEHFFEDKLKGMFDDDSERDKYITEALSALRDKILSDMVLGDINTVSYEIEE